MVDPLTLDQVSSFWAKEDEGPWEDEKGLSRKKQIKSREPQIEAILLEAASEKKIKFREMSITGELARRGHRGPLFSLLELRKFAIKKGFKPRFLFENGRHIETEIAVVSTTAAEKQCREWLFEAMLASPDERPKIKDNYWKEAAVKWKGRLSERGFNRAWSAAVTDADATAWIRGGAPKKGQSAT